MSGVPELTKGSIARIRNGEKVARPALQILAHKVSPSDPNVCRLIVSDGDYSDQNFVLIGEEFISRIPKGDFERYTVVQLKSYMANTCDGKTVGARQSRT